MEVWIVCIGIALVGAAALLIAVRVKRSQLETKLQELQNPPTIEAAKPVSEALRLVRGVLKNKTFRQKQWTIKEDNPNGMLIAVLSFDEDLAKQAGLAKRQLILTASISAPEEITEVKLMYSVYSTFGTLTADAILKETTEAITLALRD